MSDVVFSYGGMFSVYMRFKYFNLVVGSIVVSVFIFLLFVNFKRDFFWEDVIKVINFVLFINYILYLYIFGN